MGVAMTPGDTNGDSRETLGRVARHTLVVVAIIGLALLVWRIIDALLLAFVGVLLATVFRGLAGLISRHTPIPIGGAMILVAILLVVLIGLFVWFAGPPINDQLSQLTKTLPASLNNIKETMQQSVVGRFVLDYAERAGTVPTGGLFSGVTGIASTAYNVLVDVILVIVSAIYFSVNPGVYRRGVLLLVPRSRTARVAEVLDRTGHTLQCWLLGQLMLMVSVGVLVTVGLWLIDLPLAFLLGTIAGVLEFVPVIGPLAAAVPGILIALTGGWIMALDTALVYLAVQQVENHILTPLVQRTTVDVPPALVVLAVVAFGYLFGLIGVFVATPMTAVALVWVRLFYVEDVLGKSVNVR
jgi:predicted PurR-regulated permease PerM